ncbi:MAG: hypothetical protein ACLFUI_04200 [Halanaerobiales bacterium]
MYKINCKKCGHNNYSASRTGSWKCCYCGQELKFEKENENQDKKLEKLA